ncbi:glycosyl hydrolase family 28-related protein [Paenibacillus sp. BSR1-1]|uniref:glycosyl hydrolase family 28-related protein n=1 Tax=Paenibacillus sp. BSR1-1 TaxID=3020845 RepID=UPI0025AF489C|nr:glycosyl hydrolase family 28-related protein [Paenibacillus sp. BSR1-1]MDN3017455.1 glycosyl hydrolase family 28-related protein [Paenibacillus sp. BSR1-1]
MVRKNIEMIIQECKKVINVTDFGADPSGQTDSTDAIWRAFESAKETEGPVVIDFPLGTYQLQKGTAQKRVYHTSNTNSIEYPVKHIALLLEEQNHVIVNGNGSLFMIHGDCMAIAIVKSKDIYLHNFSWDFADPTTIEMTVINTGEWEDGEFTDFYIPSCFNFSISENENDVIWYSEKNPVNGQYYWTDKNHKDAWTLVAYHPDINITRRYSLHLGPFSDNRVKVLQTGKSTIRVFYDKKRPFLHKEGLVFEFCSTPRRETAGAFIWESSDTVVDKVNVHYMHAFGWLTQMSHNVSYYDCTFKTREESERYTSSYADLIHVSGASGHVHIEGCTFNHAHDDPINVHGTFTRVEKKIDDYTLLLRYIQRQQGGFPQYYVGDQVVFYHRETLTHGSDQGRKYTVTKVVNPEEIGTDLRSMIVTFDQPIPFELLEDHTGEPLFVAENVTYTPSVYIKNNLFETISTRGILCTTNKKVIIEQNIFKHMAMDSIYLSNDSQYWYESGPICDMTIRSNKFYVAKVGQAKWRNAAIRIEPITLRGELPHFTNTIHRNIKIEDNEFYMEHESVLVANSVNYLTFTNNKIYKYHPDLDNTFPRTLASEEKEEGRKTKTFELSACNNVRINQNTFEEGFYTDLSYSKMPLTNILVSGIDKCNEI